MNFISPCQSWQHEVEWDGFPQPLGPHPQRARSEAPTWVFHETEAKKLFLPDNPLWCALPLWKAKLSLINLSFLCSWRIIWRKMLLNIFTSRTLCLPGIPLWDVSHEGLGCGQVHRQHLILPGYDKTGTEILSGQLAVRRTLPYHCINANKNICKKSRWLSGVWLSTRRSILGSICPAMDRERGELKETWNTSERGTWRLKDPDSHIDTESTTVGGRACTIASRPIRFGYWEDCWNLIGLEAIVRACPPSVVLSVSLCSINGKIPHIIQ